MATQGKPISGLNPVTKVTLDDQVELLQDGSNRRASMEQVKEAIVGDVDYVDFKPQETPLDYVAGRMFYDSTENTWTGYNDIEGTSLQIGEELRARLINDTGATLPDGLAVSIIGAIGSSLKIELLDTSDFNSSVRGFGLITLEVLNGDPSYAVRYGAVNNLDTSSLIVGDIVYGDPDNPGGLTTTRPVAPNYPVRIGICLISDPVSGAIAVDTLSYNGSDTDINIQGTLNGVVVQTQAVQFYEDGGEVYAEVTNEDFPTKNLPFIDDGVLYWLDTTTNTGPNGGAIVKIPEGTDTDLQFSAIFVYNAGSTPTLSIATVNPIPADNHASIGSVAMFSYTRTISDASVFGFRRTNDAPNNGQSDGFNRFISDAIREKLGTNWESGVDGTVTISAPSIKISTVDGRCRQLHEAIFTAQDGNTYWIFNNNANEVVYEQETDLGNITEDASGNTLLARNTYYRLRVYGMHSSGSAGGLGGTQDRLIITRPLGSYGTASEAIVDSSNLDVVFNDTNLETIVFPLYTIVIGRTSNGGVTIALTELINNRSKLASQGGGGGGGATTFLGLEDTPSTYTGQAGNAVVVNSNEDGLETTFLSGAIVENVVPVNGTTSISTHKKGYVLKSVAIDNSATSNPAYVEMGYEPNASDAAIIGGENIGGSTDYFPKDIFKSKTTDFQIYVISTYPLSQLIISFRYERIII